MYPYIEDGPRLDTIVQRPIVPTRLVGAGNEASDGLYALVDSGCEHVLASNWLSQAVGVDPKPSGRQILLAIGGQPVQVRFADVRVRLLAPGEPDDDRYVEWETEVGFISQWKPTFQMILGQTGFLDKFTVTMSSFARQTAVERVEAFDERFGVALATE